MYRRVSALLDPPYEGRRNDWDEHLPASIDLRKDIDPDMLRLGMVGTAAAFSEQGGANWTLGNNPSLGEGVRLIPLKSPHLADLTQLSI
jgi:hypothetical protein